MQKRHVAIITGTGRVVVREEKIPALLPNQALVKVDCSLISPGTEIIYGVKARRDKPDPKVADMAFGYSGAGTVVKLNGKNPQFKPGTRVAIMGGGFAVHGSYACVPVNLMEPIADSLAFEEAVYACLAATALHSLRRTAPQLGEYGAVMGLGIVGNLAAQLYQLAGARVIGWEGFAKRVAMAKKCGIRNVVNFKTEKAEELTRAFAAPYGLDFANFAFGGDADAAFKTVLGLMKKSPDTHQMGRIVMVGGCKISLGGGAASGNVDVCAASRTGPGYHDAAYEFGADYPNSFVQFTTRRNLREVVALMAEKRLKISPMTTHQRPLSDVDKMATALIEKPNDTLGVVLKMPK